jgi:hypothetical protein
MSLSILEIVENEFMCLKIVDIIEITLICIENVENEFMCCRNCRKYLYLFRKFRKLIYLMCKL